MSKVSLGLLEFPEKQDKEAPEAARSSDIPFSSSTRSAVQISSGRRHRKVGSARTKANLEIKLVPHILSKEMSDERIKRLTGKIIRALEGARRRDQFSGDIDDVLNPEFEKVVGI